MNNNFDITEIKAEDSPMIASFVSERWGSPMSVSRGKMFDTTDLPGFICKGENGILGLLTYHIESPDCEIVTLNSLDTNRGLATQLIDKVTQKARESGCQRIWLITTNDNTNAMRFYQKRGFEWVGFYKDAMDESRKLKPEIPAVGEQGIPMKHEIEFELRL